MDEIPFRIHPLVVGTSRIDISVKFGELLREKRAALGISQERLAIEAGVDRSYVGMLERGTSAPTIVTVMLLAPALGMPAYKLVKALEDAMRE